ncbi:MAG TPA: hypothetical protein VFP89_00920 [Propionibacteriaceae bacterium]|nr:hypothetical protein [Propionibacteriaceae bacterium]
MSGSGLLAVVGAHLSGQPLNRQLVARGAELVETTHTAPSYRLYALATDPPKPGLVRVSDGGTSIEVEVWRLDAEAFGDFVWQVPRPMTIGKVELVDGSLISGFGVEQIALVGAPDISSYGGWRAWLATRP